MALGNTSIRIIVSAIAIPLIVAACIIGGISFLIFVIGIALISFWEFSELVKNKNANSNFIFGALTILTIILNAYFNFIDFFALVILASVLILLYELFRNSGSAILNIGSTFLGIFYLGLFSSTILLLREFYADQEMLYSEGGYLIISILVAIWICDSAAFFLGSAFGKHKLFPRVSPNKSWEGAIAGFIFAILAMIAAKALVLDSLSLFDSVVIGIIVGTIGQIGDLVESLIKRDAGVKDSSSLIPGHGGIFDRFDSLFLTAPTVYLYLYFFI
ncbi:MAG: phosphatidate cytidylyltransferase [Ignavibacteriales bacterium]|nr:phosphatidate cytidylyltransferase [Ignavibacteriales bacterium]MCB9220066.1 phosphatidate cytidylyltransferase [Ignavibacteriales bacterium]